MSHANREISMLFGLGTCPNVGRKVGQCHWWRYQSLSALKCLRFRSTCEASPLISLVFASQIIQPRYTLLPKTRRRKKTETWQRSITAADWTFFVRDATATECRFGCFLFTRLRSFEVHKMRLRLELIPLRFRSDLKWKFYFPIIEWSGKNIAQSKTERCSLVYVFISEDSKQEEGKKATRRANVLGWRTK